MQAFGFDGEKETLVRITGQIFGHGDWKVVSDDNNKEYSDHVKNIKIDHLAIKWNICSNQMNKKLLFVLVKLYS